VCNTSQPKQSFYSSDLAGNKWLSCSNNWWDSEIEICTARLHLRRATLCCSNVRHLYTSSTEPKCFSTQARTRTVPIPSSITPVPGYPDKLVVFKIAASKYWQTRCWLSGVTHRKSTKTQSLRVAQSVARRFYDSWLLVLTHRHILQQAHCLHYTLQHQLRQLRKLHPNTHSQLLLLRC